MPIVHIEGLYGSGAPALLPRARKELRVWDHFKNVGSRLKRIPVTGGYIQIRQVDELQFILIDVSGGYYFEFQTSGLPIETGTVTGTLGDYTAYQVATVGVNVTKAGSKLKTSSFIGRNIKQLDATEESSLARPAQSQLIDEPVNYPGSAVYESWAPGHPHTSTQIRSWNKSYNATSAPEDGAGNPQVGRGPVGSFVYRDIDFDIPFMYGKGRAKTKRGYIRDGADWPRASAIQTVKSTDHGTRSFGISVDVYGHFYIFPLSEIGDLKGLDQNVGYYQVMYPILPLWCYRPTDTATHFYGAEGQQSFVKYPELDWKFHPDGTKACVVAYEREPAVFDSTYFATNPGSNQFTLTNFNTYQDTRTGVTLRQQVTFPGLAQRYNSGPGLVEISINIQLNGDQPFEFKADYELTEVRTPRTSDRCTFLAGYCYHDILQEGSKTEYQVRRGDMVCVDIERWYNTAGAHPAGGTGFSWSFMSLQNLTKATELRTWWGTGIGGEAGTQFSCKMVDYDLPTLSFALRTEYDELSTRSMPSTLSSPGYPAPIATTYHTCDFGINVFAMNKQKEVLYPSTISDVGKAAIEAIKTKSARDFFATVPTRTYVYLPLNDLRNWASTDMGQIRDYEIQQQWGVYKNFPMAITSPSTVNLIWFDIGLQPYLNGPGLLYLTEPRFSWYAYTDEIANHCWLTLHSTFFGHSTGSWAFFDQSMIFNKNGMSHFSAADSGFTSRPVDTLTSWDPALLEHCIFDHVHFEQTSGTKTLTKDTSFMELYNKAVDSALKTEKPPNLQNVALTDLRATFTKQTASVPSIKWLDLKTVWFGTTGFYRDSSVCQAITSNPVVPFSDSEGMYDLSLGATFWPGAGSAGTPFYYQDAARPVKFSSCVLIK